MEPPETRYVDSGGINLAYQIFGDGPLDLVVVPGFVSNLDTQWSDPMVARFNERLASFARVIMYDKAGTGLSDPSPRCPRSSSACETCAPCSTRQARTARSSWASPRAGP